MSMIPPIDPYAPPAAEVVDAPLPEGSPLASRWRRLGAACVDAGVGFAAFVAVYVGAYVLLGVELFPEEEELSWAQLLWSPDLPSEALWFALYLLLQGPLLWWRGQTIGKLLLGTRIVGPDGRKASLGRILLRRDLPFAVASVWPGVGMIASLFDMLLIFRRDRRCLHDHLAGTRVVIAR